MTDVRTVAPRLLVRDGAAAIEFYRNAFDAEEHSRYASPDGQLVHAEIGLGDAAVMLSEDDEDTPEHLDGRVTAIMEVQCSDVDAAWQRAVRAGAEVIFPLADQFYGERSGRLRDPFGHQWILSQPID